MKKKTFLKINFYIKISTNLGGNFSNLGSNCLDIWHFFNKTFWHSKEQVFSILRAQSFNIGTTLSCQQWFLQSGRCATKEEKPLRATVCFSIEHARPRDITFSCKKQQQNNNFALTSQFFVHFFPFLHVYDVKKMRNFAFFFFHGERKSSKTKFYSLSSLDIMVLRNSTPSFVRPLLTKLVSRNNRDKD